MRGRSDNTLISVRSVLLAALGCVVTIQTTAALPNGTILWEGDIVADYCFIARWYGEDVADQQVQRGLVKPPEGCDDTAPRIDGRGTFNFDNFAPYYWLKYYDAAQQKYVVPYTVASAFSSGEKTLIESWLNQLSASVNGVVDFQRYDAGQIQQFTKGYIKVINDAGCYSYVGRIGGEQELSLQRDGCLYDTTVKHEFMHALGFFHEQSRPDRDDYVMILWDNIENGYQNNFEKENTNTINSMGSPYDLKSIMHYGRSYFSKNGQPTIVKPNGEEFAFGELGCDYDMQCPTTTDLDQIKKMYACSPESSRPCSSSPGPSTSSTTAAPSSCTLAECKAIVKSKVQALIDEGCSGMKRKKKKKCKKQVMKTLPMKGNANKLCKTESGRTEICTSSFWVS